MAGDDRAGQGGARAQGAGATSMFDPAEPIYLLRGLAGARPAAPDWFTRSLAAPRESFAVEVAGATIDCLAWGERGKPGLVLLHGNSAHLGWWDFLGPYFADEYRVIAFSFGGMGRSDRRPRYSYDLYAVETLAVAEAGGAYDAGLPFLVGHSMGGNPLTRIAARQPDRLRGAITIDTARPLHELTGRVLRTEHKVYPDIVTALDRFRLTPPQDCENLFLVDHVARMGLMQVEGGWTWRFDPTIWGGIDRGDMWADLAAVRVPYAMMCGELSPLARGKPWDRAVATAPAGTPTVVIPGASHHVMLDQPLATVAAVRAMLAGWR